MSLNNQQLEDRIIVIEEKLNEIQTALNSLATKRQLKQLLNIRQAEIDELQQKVASLETQVAALQTFHQ